MIILTCLEKADILLSTLISLKMDEQNAAESAAELRVKIFRILIWNAKLFFSLLASLSSANLSEIQVNNSLVSFHARVNLFRRNEQEMAYSVKIFRAVAKPKMQIEN